MWSVMGKSSQENTKRFSKAPGLVLAGLKSFLAASPSASFPPRKLPQRRHLGVPSDFLHLGHCISE